MLHVTSSSSCSSLLHATADKQYPYMATSAIRNYVI